MSASSCLKKWLMLKCVYRVAVPTASNWVRSCRLSTLLDASLPNKWLKLTYFLLLFKNKEIISTADDYLSCFFYLHSTTGENRRREGEEGSRSKWLGTWLYNKKHTRTKWKEEILNELSISASLLLVDRCAVIGRRKRFQQVVCIKIGDDDGNVISKEPHHVVW